MSEPEAYLMAEKIADRILIPREYPNGMVRPTHLEQLAGFGGRCTGRLNRSDIVRLVKSVLMEE